MAVMVTVAIADSRTPTQTTTDSTVTRATAIVDADTSTYSPRYSVPTASDTAAAVEIAEAVTTKPTRKVRAGRPKASCT